MRFRRLIPVVAVAVSTFSAPASGQLAQEVVDLQVVQRIREEGLERSQLEGLARYMTEVIGPRLTGSTGMKRANEWTSQKFREWGLDNVEIQPWGEFGRGWEPVRVQARVVTPYVDFLHAEPEAWTGSTDGLVRGPAMIIDAPTPEDVEKYRGQLRNAFLLMSAPAAVEPEFEHVDRRTSFDELFSPEFGRGRYAALFGSDPATRAQRIAEYMERRRRQRAVEEAVADFAAAQGALAILKVSRFDDGAITGGSSGSREVGAPEGIPQLSLSREQYNQIYRNVQAGIPVELEVLVENRFLEDDVTQSNSLAEIPGTDKADEIVMIGAHMDSWHLGGGATDNGAGSVVMMEAMRILKALDLEPRRTIRIALWSGEEQGILGSESYLENHPELQGRISAYLNVDNGTGKIRGIWDQDNERAIPIFEQILWPFRDLGVVSVRHGTTGATDHMAFDAAGIPGFNFIQDPIDYSRLTHHSDLDTFDHLLIDDLKQAAVVVASTVYHLAMREEMMPRKGRPAMD